MAKFPFYWVDAFTEKKLGGNPCAVLLEADELTVDQMQNIAREMNLSETAFVSRSNRANFKARYFTPQGELPFAGHPTIATAHALLEAGLVKTNSKITLELPAGIIPVEVISETGHSQVTMEQLSPKFLKTYDPKEILPIFGLYKEDLLAGAPIQTVSAGTPILMIPLASHEVLKKVRYVDFGAYTKLKASGDFYFPHHFCLQGATPVGQTFARSLGTPPNGNEDPFTGSATGCMAAYLWKNKLISDPKFIAEQGHWLGRPGQAQVEVIETLDTIKSVRLTGGAVTVISGTFEI